MINNNEINAQFDIPVVLMVFKRTDKIKYIIKRISEVKPKKLYILADGPRNESEKIETDMCRKTIESLINWDCEVIKRYNTENKGVYDNIALGAKWVFQKEDKAIFLEDDNLPEVSFFHFCKDLLEKYEQQENILWICGTNYLENYDDLKTSYVFTKHLMPCGWASWSSKFMKYYDFNLEGLENNKMVTNMKASYSNKNLLEQQLNLFKMERKRHLNNEIPLSWDYHMAFSIRANNLYGISPKVNLIKNIGVDDFSIHGGNSMDNIMTKRFCGIESSPIIFPLIHPDSIILDKVYEKKVGKIIAEPWHFKYKRNFVIFLREVSGSSETDSVKVALKNLFRLKKQRKKEN